MKQQLLILSFLLTGIFPGAQSLNNTKIDGYWGIWFELGQKYEQGDKQGVNDPAPQPNNTD